MVRVTIDGCVRTRAGGTFSEWFTLLATIASALMLTTSRYLRKDRYAVMEWLIGVLILAILIGIGERSCKDKIDEANELTGPNIDKPTCVRTHTGFTSFQLAYVSLGALACLFLREKTYGRILAVAFGGIALISWLMGLVLPQRCSAKLK